LLLRNLISPKKIAFVEGRKILDGIVAMHDLFEYNKKVGMMIMSDISQGL